MGYGHGFATKFYNDLTYKMENSYKWALVNKSSSNFHFKFSYYEVDISLIRNMAQRTEKMILIGNGPSLSKTIELYKDEIIRYDRLAVNFFALSAPSFDALNAKAVPTTVRKKHTVGEIYMLKMAMSIKFA